MWPVSRRLATAYRATLIRNTRIVAVVGSYGKTTTTRAVAAALGNLTKLRPGNSRAYVAHALLQTPLAVRHRVIEVGIDGKGQMGLHSTMLKPNVVVVTTVGSEHHRSFGSIEVARAEKAMILNGLPASALAVLNNNDPNVMWMRSRTQARVLTYGSNDSCDLWVSDLRLDWPNGMTFKLHFNGKIRDVRTQLIGRHFVLSLQAAATVALAEGLDLDQVIPRLESLRPTPGRLEPVRLSNGAILLRDEFKSSLETIEVALDLLTEIEAKRKFVVLGEVSEPPGSQGPIYRHLGERIAKIADFALFLGGNFQRYAAGARRAGLPDRSIFDAKRDLARAIEILRAKLEAGDVLLVKGRDTQRLDRISLALSGVSVGCSKTTCDDVVRCQNCPEIAG